MTSRSIGLRNALLGSVLACLALTLLPSAASANFHLMKIREISGSTAGSNSAYIELQMYAAGQNQVSGHNITFWDQDGLILGTPTPVVSLPLSGANPPNGQNQRTILIGDIGVSNRDFTLDLSPYIETGVGGNLLSAGAACFEAIPVDCVSWGGGAFTGANNIPDKATPFGQPLPTTFAIRRSITAGCSTLLEAGDDTNNSANDFQPAVPRDPTSNAAAPTEKACGGGLTPPPGSNFKCSGQPATLIGTSGKDDIKGTNKRDVIVTFGGNDKVSGLGGNDFLCGSAGKDSLTGGKGKDSLIGGTGRDTLLGGAGRDTLRGQKGNDVCNGGPGADVESSCGQAAGAASGPPGPSGPVY